MIYNTFVQHIHTYDNTYSVAKVDYRGAAASKNWKLKPLIMIMSYEKFRKQFYLRPKHLWHKYSSPMDNTLRFMKASSSYIARSEDDLDIDTIMKIIGRGMWAWHMEYDLYFRINFGFFFIILRSETDLYYITLLVPTNFYFMTYSYGNRVKGQA